MAGPNRVNVNTSPVTPRTYETNLQHVGGQRQTTNRQPVDTTAEEQDRVELTRNDHATQAREGAENAAHVGTLQDRARDSEAEPLLLPAPKNEIAGLLPAPPQEDGGSTALVPYEEHLPAVIDGGEKLPVPVKAQLPAVPTKGGEVIDAEWEPVYPGTPEQGLSPYVPAGGSTPPPTTPPGGGEVPPTPPGGPAGPPPGMSQADAARNWQQYQQDQQQVQQIWMQMAADRQKWMMEMWKIIQDTQTKMYEIMQSAILYKAQVADKVNQMWDQVIRGGP